MTILPSWNLSSNMCTICNIIVRFHMKKNKKQISSQNNQTSIIGRHAWQKLIFNIEFGFWISPSPALSRRFIVEFRRNDSPAAINQIKTKPSNSIHFVPENTIDDDSQIEKGINSYFSVPWMLIWSRSVSSSCKSPNPSIMSENQSLPIRKWNGEWRRIKEMKRTCWVHVTIWRSFFLESEYSLPIFLLISCIWVFNFNLSVFHTHSLSLSKTLLLVPFIKPK